MYCIPVSIVILSIRFNEKNSPENSGLINYSIKR